LILQQENFSSPLPKFQKGDIIEAVGFPGRSKSGELSCKLVDFKVLTPCLINLPDHKVGIKNPELRASKRHLDLIANPESYAVFIKRFKIISSLRLFLEKRNFIEVETPILSELSGGAVARPFKTRLRAQSDLQLNLRIAPELFLKRLVIGGFDRVFELGKQFRDEGIDSTHNPEFTSCEFYAAYTDLEEVGKMIEDLFIELADLTGSKLLFDVPFKRLNIIEELERITGIQIDPTNPLSFLDPGLISHLPIEHRNLSPSKTFDKLVSNLIESKCIEPTFLFGHPIFTSPLAKESPVKPGTADRFELFVQGREIANAYSELNDPVEQVRRFKLQATQKEMESDAEIPEGDEEFVDALKAGMPPTTGCGIGIDRLVMLLTGQQQIRNVLLFPL
jgi:lysyl-tRNA synthetase, class II